MLIATIEDDTPSPSIYYNHLDHLNSTNIVTDEYGYTSQLLSYYPFGDMRIDEQLGEVNQTNRYTGHDYDEETSLSYMRARYQSGSIGKFISQDPVAAIAPEIVIGDPQQLNTYSYARNNPIALYDPTGLLTVAVPGTFNDSQDDPPDTWSATGDASSFLNNVGETFGETPKIFQWSGENSVEGRQTAAEGLAGMINNHQFADGEQLNIIGHSHGGNVGILASQMIDRQVDNLVTLGTPIRTVYQPGGNVSNHINVYSRFDRVQRAGEIGDPLTVTGIDPRQYSGANNVGVGLRAGILPVRSHSNLWKKNSVWSLVNSRVNQ
ncbi:RHS repeat-associated core domain-containing protein [Candidatus Pacebacteria bacterium]|nr:RHS repeat-associated core domain-containing protein [Candidatus Paceibacterota bacterium]